MLPSLLLLQKVLERMPPPEGDDACQEWPGSINSNGYGKISLWGIGTYYVHRVMYGITHGYVPAELDHICRNRRCARPDHLEAVSHLENLRRAGIAPSLACRAGHVWDEVGWWPQKNGRKCKACHRATSMRSHYRRKVVSAE